MFNAPTSSADEIKTAAILNPTPLLYVGGVTVTFTQTHLSLLSGLRKDWAKENLIYYWRRKELSQSLTKKLSPFTTKPK
jgi:hypothetical protein